MPYGCPADRTSSNSANRHSALPRGCLASPCSYTYCRSHIHSPPTYCRSHIHSPPTYCRSHIHSPPTYCRSTYLLQVHLLTAGPRLTVHLLTAGPPTYCRSHSPPTYCRSRLTVHLLTAGPPTYCRSQTDRYPRHNRWVRCIVGQVAVLPKARVNSWNVMILLISRSGK